MGKPLYAKLKETKVKGLHGSLKILKIGKKFRWLNPRLHIVSSTRAAAQRMIKEFGAGPFLCRKIRKYPSGLVVLLIIDKNGRQQEINKDYFAVK